MAVRLEYMTNEYNRTENSSMYSETYTGLLDEINTFISTLQINGYTENKGYLTSIRKSQKGGVLWQAELEYTIEFDSDSGQSENSGSGAQQSTLDGAMLSMPIEGHPSYKTNWNYYLIGLGENAKTVPTWWSTATDTFIDPTTEDFKKYRWVKSLSEIPTEKDAETNSYWQVVKQDGENPTVCKPTKPGVETYDKAVYTITEISRYSSKSKAGWAVATALNTIMDKPKKGDFGIKNQGDWKVDSASIYHDGKKWCSKLVYTLSGDAAGWDSDIYDPYEEE